MTINYIRHLIGNICARVAESRAEERLEFHVGRSSSSELVSPVSSGCGFASFSINATVSPAGLYVDAASIRRMTVGMGNSILGQP